MIGTVTHAILYALCILFTDFSVVMRIPLFGFAACAFLGVQWMILAVYDMCTCTRQQSPLLRVSAAPDQASHLNMIHQSLLCSLKLLLCCGLTSTLLRAVISRVHSVIDSSSAGAAAACSCFARAAAGASDMGSVGKLGRSNASIHSQQQQHSCMCV